MSCRRALSVLASSSLLSTTAKFHLANHSSFARPLVLRPVFQLQQLRFYAKGKSKGGSDGKNKKKGGGAQVSINENELAELVAVDTMKTQMQKVLDTLKDEFVRNLSLRSTTGSIETLKVKFDGGDHALNELAQVVRKNPKTLVVNCVSTPQAIPNILEAIKASGMNLNPQQDGTTLFIPVPVVTKEHRENLAKSAKGLFIKSRDNIKDVQNKYIKNVKKATGISEDEIFGAQQQITAIGDKFVGEAEKMLQMKHTELIGK